MLKTIKRFLMLAAVLVAVVWGASIYLRHPSRQAGDDGSRTRLAAECKPADPADWPDWELNAQEREVAMRLERDPGQRRTELRYNPVLSKVARQKARDMAARGYYAHVDPDGHGANYLVTQAGYRLFATYATAPSGNNIESIAAGHDTPAGAWTAWMNSPKHKTHLLGLDDSALRQTEYGVGYALARNSPHRHYWVVFVARPAC